CNGIPTGTGRAIIWPRARLPSGSRRRASRGSAALLFRGSHQLLKILFRIPVILLARLGKSAFRKPQGPACALDSQHVLRGRAPVAHLVGGPCDESLEDASGCGRIPALGQDLPPTQVIVVLALGLVVFAVCFLSFVDPLQGLVRVFVVQGQLNQ